MSKKISQLTRAAALTLNDQVAVNDGGASKRATVTQVQQPFFVLDGVNNINSCYSVCRRLRSAYTGPLVELVRSSDSGVLDVYWDALQNIDEAAIAVWAGADTITIRTIYDQSGNSHDFLNATVAQQPTFTRSDQNGRPACTWTAATDEHLDDGDGDLLYDDTSHTFVFVARAPDQASATTFYCEYNSGVTAENLDVGADTEQKVRHVSRTATTTPLDVTSTGNAWDDVARVLAIPDANGTGSIRLNGVEDSTFSYTREATTYTARALGAHRQGGATINGEWDGEMYEAFFLSFVDQDILDVIETNQLDYFGIA